VASGGDSVVVYDLWREAHALGEDTVDAMLSLDQSCLVIQGPPGAGKSYTVARIIAALIAKGQRVGIASNSHAAIGNLLSSTIKVCTDGSTRPVTLDDMLFVAPCNAQFARLVEAFGPSARVGSVDRFQGQGAPIVFLSLCASDASAAPRGPGFLFDRSRLNVAVSRAQTLCALVGHPRLAVRGCRV